MTTTSLRITRRGRVVLGLALALPVMALSVFLASSGALAESDAASDDFEYMTVLSGDTLWSIATMISPHEDPRDVVAKIISLNQLETASLMPGQDIALPR
ncbi:MAG: LysM peptidoglycan-binding domain-containing protein [Pontimonas sp.]|jgi:LysM repeat protein|tara:strand:- start:17924 stop:18223 length:300 start_codon:yes stop_codon:yes gene_type:complete